MTFNEYQNAADLMGALANRVASELDQQVSQNARASLAVPGGSTPGPMFDILSGIDIDWTRIDVMLTDERWVPEDSDRSNTALLRARLLQNNAAKANLVPFFQNGMPAQQGAKTVAHDIAKFLPLAVVVLGMGADMHCASLFPNAPELAQAQALDAPAVYHMTPQDGLEPRITLTAPTLLDAHSIHLLILGEEKRTAMNTAMTLNQEAAPIRQFLDHATVHWATSKSGN